MDVVSRVRVGGPLAGYAAGFAAQLAWAGYTPLSAANQVTPESRTDERIENAVPRRSEKRLSPGAGQAMSQQPGEGVDGLVVTEGPANRFPALRDPDGTESFEQGIERGGQHGRIAR